MTERNNHDDNRASNLEAPVRRISVFHDAAIRRLDVQIGIWDSLEGKAHNVLSIGSAILPITLGLLSASSFDVPLLAAILLVLAVLAYFALLACSWLILRASDRISVGEPLAMLHEHMESGLYSGEGLQLWVAEESEVSVRANDAELLIRAKHVGCASYSLYAESGLLALAGILTLFLG